MQSDLITPEWNHSVYKKQTGKLYQFLSRSVTVFSQAWPRPRAWIKTPSSNGWRNFRPTEFTIPGGDLQPQIRRLSSHADGQLLFPFGLSRQQVDPKRACNQAPSPATCQYVTDWINTQGTASVGPT
jgi:hypothetical protein